MTHYAATPALLNNLVGLTSSLSTPVMDAALTSADNFINRQVTLTSTPNEIVQIAEDYATYQCLLRLQHSSDGLSEAAKEFKQNALDSMADYIKENESEADNPKYASSMTPSNSFVDVEDPDEEDDELNEVLEGTNW